MAYSLSLCRLGSELTYFICFNHSILTISCRYGYLSLPRVLSQSIFESLVASCTDASLVSLARHWYQLDENAVPAEYVLRSLADRNDKSYWDIALPRLLELFSDAPVDRTLPDLVCNRSITEWEVKYAVLKEEKHHNSANLRMAWFHREFMGGVPAGVGSTDFDDVSGNAVRSLKLDNLKTWMTSRVPDTSVFSYNTVAYASYRTRDQSWCDSLHRFTEDLEG